MPRERLYPKPLLLPLEQALVKGIYAELGRRRLTPRALAWMTGYDERHVFAVLRHDVRGSTAFWEDVLRALELQVSVHPRLP